MGRSPSEFQFRLLPEANNTCWRCLLRPPRTRRRAHLCHQLRFQRERTASQLLLQVSAHCGRRRCNNGAQVLVTETTLRSGLPAPVEKIPVPFTPLDSGRAGGVGAAALGKMRGASGALGAAADANTRSNGLPGINAPPPSQSLAPLDSARINQGFQKNGLLLTPSSLNTQLNDRLKRSYPDAN